MKKLLFIGALLVAGATSFGAVSQELTKPSGDKYSGNASLRLITRGAVVDAVGKPMLVVTPILSAGPDGQSLSFNFGDLVKGQSQSLAGKFTVQVVTEEIESADNPTGTGKLIPLPFNDATVGIKLVSALTGTSNGTIDDKGEQAVGVKLYGDKLDTGSAREEIGQLSYFLRPNKTNDTTYTGDVTAIVNPSKTGTFVNDDIKVDVAVTNFTFNPVTVTPAP